MEEASGKETERGEGNRGREHGESGRGDGEVYESVVFLDNSI